MTQDQKIIGAKAGLLELAEQLGNVSQACKIMGFEPGQLLSVQGPLRQRGENWRCRRCRAASRSSQNRVLP
jgi:hypothetical protein